MLQYAKFLKKIDVKAIYYGAWEVRDTEKNMAPVFDLTVFNEILDWSAAANDFITFGSAKTLLDLTQTNLEDHLRKVDKEAIALKELMATIN